MKAMLLVCLSLARTGSSPLEAAEPGEKLWEFQTGGAVQGCPALGTDGTAYVGSGDKNVYALDGATGQKRWEFLTGGPVQSSPALGPDGTVYVGSQDGMVYALNGATGQELWAFRTDGWVSSSSPAVATSGTVYVGVESWGYGKVFALNGATGQQLWEFQTGDRVSSSPAIGLDGTVYVGSSDKKIYALNGTTGLKLWEFQTGNGVGSSPAIGDDGTVYVGSDDGKAYALDGATGLKRWEFHTVGASRGSSPAVGADGTVYVAGSAVYSLNGANGQWRWEFRGGSIFASSPAIGADGTLYLGCWDKKVYALNGTTGLALWEFETGGEVNSSPAIGADGTVYIGSDDGKVYALGSSSVGGLAESPWPKFHANAANRGRVSAVGGPARIVSQSGDSMLLEGMPLVLAVGGYGTPPLTYEWFFNGQVLAGVTGPRYEVAAFAASQAGVYRVRVSNAEGTAESADMVVTLAYQVSVGLVGPGRVDGMNGSGDYAAGSVLELTAVPDEGCWFAGWQGDVSSQANPLPLTVDRAWRLTAHFGGAKPGMRLWKFPTDGEVRSCPAIGADGTVYFGSSRYKVFALNGATGQALWESQDGGGDCSPAMGADGTVFVGGGGVAALDALTGRRKWQFAAGYVVSSLAIGVEGRLYAGVSWKVYALSAATGEKLWEFSVERGVSSPSIGLDGTVYLVPGRKLAILFLEGCQVDLSLDAERSGLFSVPSFFDF